MNVGADAFNMQFESITLDRLLSFRTEGFCLAILVTFILSPSIVLSQSLWGLWVLVRTGLFEPSECFWPVRGLILNAVLPLLPSCWGVAFVLGCGVSPQSRSPATPLHAASTPAPTVLLGLLCPWTRVISLQALPRHTASAPAPTHLKRP